jgi:large subunit ribosomal protein L21
MYAIFEAKGKQFRAEMGATLRLPVLDAEPGEQVTFDQILLAHSEDRLIVGQPALDGASIAAEVLCHGRDDKIVVYKMKRRKGYRRKQGHRQGFTEVRVLDIDFGKGKSVKAAPPEAKKEAPTEQAPKAKAKKPKAEKAAAPEAPAAAEAPEVSITDSARALAEEAGVDIATIEGTGKAGRILKSDVQKAIKQRDEE